MTPVIVSRNRDGRVAARIATAGLLVLFLAGLWLCAAPFALDDQPRTGPWLIGTRNDLITGGILAIVSTLGLLIATIAAVRKLYRCQSPATRIGGQDPARPTTAETDAPLASTTPTTKPGNHHGHG
jgi:hypothetical protein